MTQPQFADKNRLTSSADDDPMMLGEVAELLGVSEMTVRRYYADEGLPVHRLGSARNAQVRFFRAEVLAWLRSRWTAKNPGQA